LNRNKGSKVGEKKVAAEKGINRQGKKEIK
jgi:hypothetical protein